MACNSNTPGHRLKRSDIFELRDTSNTYMGQYSYIYWIPYLTRAFWLSNVKIRISHFSYIAIVATWLLGINLTCCNHVGSDQADHLGPWASCFSLSRRSRQRKNSSSEEQQCTGMRGVLCFNCGPPYVDPHIASKFLRIFYLGGNITTTLRCVLTLGHKEIHHARQKIGLHAFSDVDERHIRLEYYICYSDIDCVAFFWWISPRFRGRSIGF